MDYYRQPTRFLSTFFRLFWGSKQLLTSKNSALFFSLFLFSYPVTAAGFSFVEFNIAFVLGLSLPVLIITSLIKPLIKVQLRYPALSSLFLLGLLYTLAHLYKSNIAVLLSFASCFLTAIVLWPPNTNDKTASTKKLFTTRASFVAAGIYLGMVWFLPQFDAFLGWLIFGVTLLLLSGMRLANLLHGDSIITVRVFTRWILIIALVVSTFLWLNVKLADKWYIAILVLSYVITLLSGSWTLVQAILDKLSNKYRNQMMSLEDVYTYTHDHATNLPSHQYALNKLELEIKSTNRKYAAVVFRPLNFQQVNQVLGHHNSDILLLQFVFTISQALTNKSELFNFEGQSQPVRVARLQSLHFLVALDLTDNPHPEETVLEALAKQISDAVPSAMSYKSFSLHLELAFGAAIIGQHGKDMNDVIACAEDALLVAEKQKELLHLFTHDTNAYSEQNLRLMEQLQGDIEEEKLSWFLEPQVNLGNKKITGFELSVAWQGPGTAKISLDETITLAEQSGKVHLLTKQLITQAFKLLFSLQKIGVYQPVAISLSSKDLLEPDLVDYIESKSQSYNIPTKYLLVELTEPVMLDACLESKTIIDQLKSIEVCISIDQFSGSYEALRYMRKMSINQVKIACQGLTTSKDTGADKAIINALVNLTKTMGIPLVGTGIDNKDIEQVFIKIGGEIGQGRLIKHKLNVEEATHWVKSWRTQYPHLVEENKLSG